MHTYLRVKEWMGSCAHAHNFKIKKTIVSKSSIKIKIDYTIMFISIRASKQDPTPLYFIDIFFM
jgi:hypothetical protein